MKKSKLVLLMLVPFLASCTKTSELYDNYAFNSPNFMKNYFSEQNGTRDLEAASTTEYNLLPGIDFDSSNSLVHVRSEDNVEKYPWSNPLELDKEWGRHNNLTTIDNSFAYGYLSKLYDGRVRCEGKYQLSRVQIDKNGYGTFFPKMLANYKYFAFSLRGATDYENTMKNPSPLSGKVIIDVQINFFRHITNSNQYNVVKFNMKDVEIPCDNGGDTNLVTLYLADDFIDDGVLKRSYRYDLTDVVAMNMSYTLKTTREDLSDDASVEKDHHFAVMLYEVMFPRSNWR